MAQTVTQGKFTDLISDIVDTIPPRDSHAFVQPTSDQISVFINSLVVIQEGDFAMADEMLSEFNYSLVKFINIHESEQDTLYVVTENQPIQYGWGTYVWRSSGKRKVHVQVPHPLFDQNTPEVGARAFNELNASYFSMAGTHRYANGEQGTNPESDMARNASSIFQAVHELWSEAAVVQIHGFNDSNSVYANYPEAVISNGTINPPEILYRMRNRFHDRNFTAEVYDNDTRNQLSLLAATQNPQGQWSAAEDKVFIHLELARFMRLANYQIGQVTKAITETFGEETEENESIDIPESVVLFQNYPNPFNSGTVISYSIDEPGDVTLQIFDISGKVVQQRISIHTTPGKKSYQFTPNGLASGTYIYKLIFNNGYSTVNLQRIMTLIK